MLNAGKGAAKQLQEIKFLERRKKRHSLVVKNWHTGNSSRVILRCRSNPRKKRERKKMCELNAKTK